MPGAHPPICFCSYLRLPYGMGAHRAAGAALCIHRAGDVWLRREDMKTIREATDHMVPYGKTSWRPGVPSVFSRSDVQAFILAPLDGLSQQIVPRQGGVRPLRVEVRPTTPDLTHPPQPPHCPSDAEGPSPARHPAPGAWPRPRGQSNVSRESTKRAPEPAADARGFLLQRRQRSPPSGSRATEEPGAKTPGTAVRVGAKGRADRHRREIPGQVLQGGAPDYRGPAAGPSHREVRLALAPRGAPG